MANIFNGFLDNLVNGALSPKGDMADYAHAARLYTDDNFRLAPKQKFLYHVTLNLNENVINKILPGWVQRHSNEVNMLVKSVTMPKFDIQTETKNKYNRKKNVQTRIDYAPVNIVFHDDNNSIVTQLWTAYYNYYFVDGTYGSRDGAGAPNQTARPYDRFNTYMGSPRNGDRFGLDNNQYEPFFTSIQISQMARHQYLTLTLVNPIIESWQHDTLENSVGADPVQNSMTVAYESVFYADGPIDEGNSPKGFGTVHYDNTPSPLVGEYDGGYTPKIIAQPKFASTTTEFVQNPVTNIPATSIFGNLFRNNTTVTTTNAVGRYSTTTPSSLLTPSAIGSALSTNPSKVATLATSAVLLGLVSGDSPQEAIRDTVVSLATSDPSQTSTNFKLAQLATTIITRD